MPPRRSYAVSPRVRKYARVLRALERADAGTRHAAVHAAKRDLVLALVDVAKMIINRRIPLSAEQLRRIQRHSTDIRALVDARQTVDGRKRVLQKGGFLPVLLAPLLKTLLPSLLGGLLSR